MRESTLHEWFFMSGPRPPGHLPIREIGPIAAARAMSDQSTGSVRIDTKMTGGGHDPGLLVATINPRPRDRSLGFFIIVMLGKVLSPRDGDEILTAAKRRPNPEVVHDRSCYCDHLVDHMA